MWSTSEMEERETPGFTVTRARPRDSASMRDLARKAFEIYITRIGVEPGPMAADYETIAAVRESILVWRADELVGMLVTTLEEDALLVDTLAMAPTVQGSGLGSMLLAEAERLARGQHKMTVRLYTHETMVENIAFYRRRGYRETHRATEDGMRRVFFSKSLASPGDNGIALD
jgi:ribosomal protein S18 acetylase RimI-like enzyme